jgi:hypothetical protein
MNQINDDELKPRPEQVRYANILFLGAWIGIFLMIITYIIYLGGILSPHVDPILIVQNWDKGIDEYLHITNSPHGWSWLSLLSRGDYANFIGLTLLAVLTIFCYFFLIVGYGKRKDWPYLFICILEVLVLALAASGILGSGGH